MTNSSPPVSTTSGISAPNAAPTQSAGSSVEVGQHSIAAYLGGFVMIGLSLSLAGPSLSHLRDRLGTTDGGIGLVFAGQSAGYIVGSLLGGRLLDRGGGHRWWTAAMAVITMSVLGVAASNSLPLMISWFVLLGLACAICDVAGNTLVVWSRPVGPGAALNGLHLCFAIGALSTPLVITVVVGATLLRSPEPVRTRHAETTHTDRPAARSGRLLLVAAFFFVYVAVEMGVAGWIHSYVEQINYGDSRTATAVTVMFWAGFTCGRVTSIWLSRVLSPGQMVGWSTGASVVAAVAFLVFDGPGPMLWVVVCFFAFTVAPQFASMIAFAEAHLTLSGAATSMFVAAAGLGGLVMPPLLGRLFDTVGPDVLPKATLVLTVVTALVGLLTARAILSDQRPPATSRNAPVT
jgi:MFS transporter, FHS family, Na+ dependent glucose transporter 1